MEFIIGIIIIGGIIAGVYWYKTVDTPIEKHTKRDLSNDTVVLDMRHGVGHGMGMLHNEADDSDSDSDGN